MVEVCGIEKHLNTGKESTVGHASWKQKNHSIMPLLLLSLYKA